MKLAWSAKIHGKLQKYIQYQGQRNSVKTNSTIISALLLIIQSMHSSIEFISLSNLHQQLKNIEHCTVHAFQRHTEKNVRWISQASKGHSNQLRHQKHASAGGMAETNANVHEAKIKKTLLNKAACTIWHPEIRPLRQLFRAVRGFTTWSCSSQFATPSGRTDLLHTAVNVQARQVKYHIIKWIKSFCAQLHRDFVDCKRKKIIYIFTHFTS